MLDQSFSAENFRRIFDDETRKGVDIASMFFPNLVAVNLEIKNIRNLIKTDKVNEDTHYNNLKSELNKKEEIITEIFNDLAEKANTAKGKVYDLKILKDTSIGEKPVYKLNKSDAVSYFIIKLIQKFIRKLYKVKQADRNQIVSQLSLILADGFHKKILRTDIQEFYESIPQEELLKIIDRENLLSHTNKIYIKKILSEFNALSGSTKGLPRGIGISAYLAELYLRNMDQEIKKDEEIIFFARYVDDIAIVYAPKPDSSDDKLANLKKIIKSYGLEINTKKTIAPQTIPDNDIKFDYLGYQFQFKNKKLEIEISFRKFKKYIKRIQISFERFRGANSAQRNLERKLLISRIRYLSQNTKLSGRKSNTLIGIYFSNRLLPNATLRITSLDKYLIKEINSLTTPQLKTALSKFKFTDGFNKKSFFKTTAQGIHEISKIWS